MLLKIAMKDGLLQELMGEKHPEVDIYGYVACPCCGSHLHGHGWRRRYRETGRRRFEQIWVHRKRCPACGRTYTIIPEGMPALYAYPLARIAEVLEYRHLNGHLSSGLGIPWRTMRRFWRRFMDRVVMEKGTFPKAEEVAASIAGIHPFTVLPACFPVFGKCAKPQCAGPSSRAPHHKLQMYDATSPA